MFLKRKSLDTLQEELTSIFAKEAAQHIDIIQEAINKNISCATLIDQDLMRILHTIGGSAQTAGVTQISELCHALENIVSTVVKNQINLTIDQADFIRVAVGKLRDDLQKLEKIIPLEQSDEKYIQSLEEFNNKLLQGLAKPEDKLDKQGEKTAESSLDASSVSSMVDVHTSVDQDLSEIFFEEAEDVLSSCQSSIQRFGDNHQASEALSELRRQFHTLKGSSRMAGIFYNW